MIFADWSMLRLVEKEGEPSPRGQALTTGTVPELKKAAVPQ
jgi:hypothetical protein